MTPKEKAEEIYNKCLDKIQGLEGTEWWESAKQCATIAVDEILSVLRLDDKCTSNKALVYWLILVKEELQKL
jgi:hypothetical protein